MDGLAAFVEAEALGAGYREMVERVAASLPAKSRVIAINGAQGSGKSTLARALAAKLADEGKRVAILSLDDLYLPRATRARLAAEVHPLLRTRGPPGTHDVALGVATIGALLQGGQVRVPRFDKGVDDRAADEVFDGPADLVLFEGWCVGARAQALADLAVPINALERDEDAAGVWRRYVNDALAGPYQQLFALAEALVMLQAASFDVVLGWRREQEAKLRAKRPGAGMSDAELARFVRHYERLTRAMLAEMPARADALVALDATRTPLEVRRP